MNRKKNSILSNQRLAATNSLQPKATKGTIRPAPSAVAGLMLLLTSLFGGSMVEPTHAQDYLQAGRYEVKETDGNWKDADRNNRNLAWRLYQPAAVEEKVPCVIYSHGIGGTKSGNALLGMHLASHGIAALHVQHVGSDRVALLKKRRSIGNLVNDPKLAVDRFVDIRFAVAQLKRAAREDVRFRKIDTSALGISGHSLGGLTTQIVAGQNVSGFGQDLAIAEFKGAFVLSPSPPRPGYGDADNTFDSMLMPIFHATGTRDEFPDQQFNVTDRAVPFNKISNVDQWLLVMEGATHFTMSGNSKMPRLARFLPGMKADPNLNRNHTYLKIASLTFWRMIFFNDPKAKEFMDRGKFEQLIGSNGTFKSKTRLKRSKN